MSSKIMINCISELPPAKSNGTDTQLMHGLRGDHDISNILSNIKNFTNRFIQCRQNTVVALMGSIQHCIFWNKTGRILYTPVDDRPCSQGIICAEKNERYNHHDNLAQVRKSEKTLQYSDQHNMIEADMRNNCNNFNNAKKRKRLLRVERQTIFFTISELCNCLFHPCRTIFL